MLDRLDATAIRRWCAAALAALRRHQDEIDALNVFPVPDGDTGTNLVLTVVSAEAALTGPDTGLGPDTADREKTDVPAADRGADGDAGDEPPGLALRRMARGALLGARGNSGVIVSQLLRGLADTLAAEVAVRGRALAAALGEAARSAYAAVATPVEGTVLSVASAAAEAARAAESDDLATVATAAAKAAAEALARTPSQLPALARAGVVDAGGRGLVVLLDALVEVITGEAAPVGPPAVVKPTGPLVAARETGSSAYAYEVQYLLDAPDVDDLRGKLAALGDSLVVVGTGDGTWNVHVHVNDIGAAVEAGVEAGRPYRISVTRFEDQAAATGRGVVVVAPGPGLADVIRAEGAAVVTGTPSTAELLAAIRATGAAEVVLLPDDRDTHGVARLAAAEARAEGRAVSVIPTRAAVQALAALAVRDPGRRFDEDVIAMAEAAGACRYAELTVAARDALTMAGTCRAGDIIALAEGDVILIGETLAPMATGLLDRLLGAGGELVTLVYGDTATDALRATVAAHLAATWPLVEARAYEGGQPHYPLMIGVE